MGAAAASPPASAVIERSKVGRDLSVTTFHVYLGDTGEARQIGLDGEGKLSITKCDVAGTTVLVVDSPASANPYKSLEVFQENDADRFFGRDAITTLLWQRFRELHATWSSDNYPLRFLPILGPSGSGKSSLARAGLIPKLVQHPLPGFGSPRVAIFTPGVHPLEALARVLARIATGDVADIRRTEEFEQTLAKTYRNGESEGLRRIAESLPNADSAHLFLLIDQFEEIFSLCHDADVQRAFFDNLIHAANDPAGAVSVIITLRSDFLDATVQHQALNQALSKSAVIVPVMSDQERREAIEQPALRAGRPIDAATVDLLMEQTAGREGALPLLQFVLSRIWEGMERGVVPAETVKALGGVGGALAGEVQSIYDALDKAQKRIARRAFLSLIQLGEGTRDTLRRSYLSEMTARTECDVDVRKVLGRFADPGRRLITLSADSSGKTTAEITHEALIDHWGTLRRWIEESRDDIRLHRRFGDSARNWNSHTRPDGLLWRSPDLDLMKRFSERFQHDLTEIEASFLEAATDLEEREREERRIREEKERQHAQNQNILDAVGQLSVGIAILNHAGIIRHVNRGLQDMTDVPSGGVGRSCAELFASDDHAALWGLLEHSKRERYPMSPIEVRPICARQRVALLSAIRLDKQPAGGRMLLCLVDITDRRNLEQQFSQSQKMQWVGELARGISHDFNNLLTTMIGFSDLLLLRHRPGDQSFADVMQIKQNAARAANLVRQLLAFSRQQSLQPRLLNVTDILAELLHLLRRLIGENIDLDMNHGRDLGNLKADLGQLEQVIINLAVNARDAMPGGGKLSIRTSNTTVEREKQVRGEVMPPGDYVLIEVSDTGTGISPENMDHIFDPFFSTKELGAGTGLGLSTVYGIVRQTGGYVFVESTPGAGSTFSIYLPCHFEEQEEAQDRVLKPTKVIAGPARILIVGDDTAVRTFCGRALRNAGHDVTEATDSQEAMEIIESGPPLEMLIFDIVTPGMDVLSLAREVRHRHPNKKFLLITGFATEPAVRQFKPVDEFPVLRKPFGLRTLVNRVNEILAEEPASNEIS